MTQFNMQNSLSEACLYHESYQIALGKLQAKILLSILIYTHKNMNPLWLLLLCFGFCEDSETFYHISLLLSKEMDI